MRNKKVARKYDVGMNAMNDEALSDARVVAIPSLLVSGDGDDAYVLLVGG